MEGSLARLGVDTIDLYQHHTPDTETPVEETIAALAELVTEGKVREIGNSNYDAGMLRRADESARASGGARFVSAQNQYNLLERSAEDELLPAAEDLGVGFLPFFPLANGLFTGKFTRTHRPADTRIMRQRPHVADDAPWDAMEAFAAFAATRGIGMLEATIGWLLSRPALASVIAGATTPDQVRQNAAAGGGWQPPPPTSPRSTRSSPLTLSPRARAARRRARATCRTRQAVVQRHGIHDVHLDRGVLSDLADQVPVRGHGGVDRLGRGRPVAREGEIAVEVTAVERRRGDHHRQDAVAGRVAVARPGADELELGVPDRGGAASGQQRRARDEREGGTDPDHGASSRRIGAPSVTVCIPMTAAISMISRISWGVAP
ncbi:MAG: aldo/keto reductase [Schumannella sp.]